MTVIAYKDGVMVADTQATDNTVRLRTSKLARLLDGGVAGKCGNCSAGWAALSWVASGGSLDGGERQPEVEGACLLIVKGDGSLWMLEDRFPAFPLADHPDGIAVGSGGEMATILMATGLSAVEAVTIVAQQNIFCGLPVQSMDVYCVPEFPGVTTHPAPKKRKK